MRLLEKMGNRLPKRKPEKSERKAKFVREVEQKRARDEEYEPEMSGRSSSMKSSSAATSSRLRAQKPFGVTSVSD